MEVMADPSYLDAIRGVRQESAELDNQNTLFRWRFPTRHWPDRMPCANLIESITLKGERGGKGKGDALMCTAPLSETRKGGRPECGPNGVFLLVESGSSKNGFHATCP